MGNKDEEGASGFLVLDDNFDPKERFDKVNSAKYGYDFWLKPKFDLMVSSEWGSPISFKNGEK